MQTCGIYFLMSPLTSAAFSCLHANRDVQCATEASLPGCSCYFNNGCNKHMEVVDPGQLHNVGQGSCALSELSRSPGLSLEVGEQYMYPSFGTGLNEDKKSKSDMELPLQARPVEYQVTSSLYDNSQQAWASAWGPCGLALYNENAWQQVCKALISFLFPSFCVFVFRS